MSSLYKEIGGDKLVSEAVEKLYTKVMEDPLLALYFEETDLEAQKDRFHRYLAHLLGGPQAYEGPSLYEIHRGKEITDLGFETFVQYFLDCLVELRISDSKVEQVRAVLLPVKNDIVDSFKWPGKHFYPAEN